MQTMKPNPDPATTELNTLAGLEQAHRALANHAFQCGRKFEDTYRQCQAEGFSYFGSYQRAVKAHDQAVRWIFEHTGMD